MTQNNTVTNTKNQNTTKENITYYYEFCYNGDGKRIPYIYKMVNNRAVLRYNVIEKEWTDKFQFVSPMYDRDDAVLTLEEAMDDMSAWWDGEDILDFEYHIPAEPPKNISKEL